MALLWREIGFGALISLTFGLTYFLLLDESGPAFYPFAGLACLGGPLIAGLVAILKTRNHRMIAFLTSAGAVMGIVFMAFVFAYVVIPQFARRNVQLPAFCDGWDGRFRPPDQLAYNLPGVGTGVLLTDDSLSAVVVMINPHQPPFPASVYLVNKSDNKFIFGMQFRNDVVSATLHAGTLYIYNDKLGYLLGAHTGELEEDFLLIDNYGGLSESDRPIISRASDGHWYMETTAVISSWKIDGTVRSRPNLTLNGIARGCFINGHTHAVTPLK